MMKLTLFNLLSRRFRRHLHRPFRSQRLFPLSPMQKIISCWFFSEYHLIVLWKNEVWVAMILLGMLHHWSKGGTLLYFLWHHLACLKSYWPRHLDIVLFPVAFWHHGCCQENQLQHLRIWGYCQLQLECGQCISVSC